MNGQDAGRQPRVERVWRSLLNRAGPRSRRMLLLARRSAEEFGDDYCPQLAGAVAFHVLFSIFPLVILVVSVFGLLADEATVRSNVLRTVTTYIPLTSGGRSGLSELLAQLQAGATALGILSVIGVVISASGMMGAVRRALTLAWDADEHRPFVRGKALDLVLVLGAGAVLGASFGLTLAVRLASEAGSAASDSLSFLGPLIGAAGWLVGGLVPLLLAFALFSFLFSVVPAVPTRLVDVWPGALVGAVLFQLLKEGFAVYLANFGHYNAVYGALGAVAAFIFFVYLSANALLLGAEVAAEYPRVLGRAPDRRDERGKDFG